MSIIITSPIGGSETQPKLVAPTFSVKGTYDATPNGSNVDPDDTSVELPVNVTLRRYVKVELMTPVEGSTAASEFSDVADKDVTGSYSINVTLAANDIRRTKPLKITPMLRVTGLADDVGLAVHYVQTNA